MGRLASAAAEARAAADEAARESRRAFYSGYEDPAFAEYVGADHICGTCGAVAAEMSKHLAWHAAS